MYTNYLNPLSMTWGMRLSLFPFFRDDIILRRLGLLTNLNA